MSKIDEQKAKLAKILKDPYKRPLLAKALVAKHGKARSDSIGLVKAMRKDFQEEVDEVLAMVEDLQWDEKVSKKTSKKKTSKKKTSKKKTSKKKTSKKGT